MTELAATVLNGIGLGAIYGLVALGFALVLKGTGILNFAHGAFMVLGAFIAYSVGSVTGFWVGFFAGMVALAALGAVLYFVVFKKLLGRGPFAGLMVTIGLFEVLLGSIGFIYGFNSRKLPSATASPRVEFGEGISVATPFVIAAAILLVTVGSLALFLSQTRIGTQIRALGKRTDVTLMMGASPALLFAIIWGVSAATGAAAGTLLASLTVADLGLAGFMLRAISGLIVGGADSLGGALVGGVLVGVVELLTGTYLGSEYRLVITMIILLGFMLVRPQGFFGSKALERA